MYLLLDSCIWIKEQGLTSNLGAAARFLIRDSGATLAIPEVVRHEAKNGLVSVLRSHRDKALSSGRRVLAAMSEDEPRLSLPTAEEIELRVSQMLNELDFETVDVPLSLEAARSAIVRAAEKRVPTGVRDGVIWQNCLELLDTADVHFVTQDEGFYADRTRTSLAPSLSEEAKQRNHSLKVHSGLDTMLKALQDARTEVVFAEDEEQLLIEQVLDEVDDWVRDIVAEDGLPLGDFDDANVESVYPATSEPHRELVVEISVRWPCGGGDWDDGGWDGSVSATVYGLLDRPTNRLRRIELRDLEIDAGDYWGSMSFPEADAVWRLVRVDAQGQKMRLEPKLRFERSTNLL